jgi:hypothetical protein
VASKNTLTDSPTRTDSAIYNKILQKECEEIGVFAQGLNNGRSCETSGQCLSGACSGEGVCVGKKEGALCLYTKECDIGLGCTPEEEFPFTMRCRKLLSTGKKCLSTTDCAMDHICWPKTPSDASQNSLTCQPIHSQPEFTIIGFKNDTSLNVMDNSIAAGQFCQSGIAKIFNSTTAMCVKIA